MGISGNLKTMELAELLQWIAQGKKTGSLLIDNGRVRKKIYFVDGKIVASASNDPSEFLGHFLVSRGLIGEQELAKAMEMQAHSKMLLGKILVTLGAITESQLQEVLVAKTEESIYDVFSWQQGEFRFTDSETLKTGVVPMALDVTHLVLEGINRLDEWKRIREVIPDVDALLPVTLGPLPLDELPSEEARILELVNDDRTIREICMHAHASDYHVCQVLFRQYLAKQVKFVRLRRGPESPPSIAAPSGSGDRAMPLVNAQALTESANRQLEEGNYARALRHLRAALSLEPDNAEIEAALRDAEQRVQRELEEEGLRPESVPVLSVPVEELTRLDLAPEEAFALSRINGTYDLKSLIKISPIDALDAMLVFHRLLEAGHIQLR